MKKCVINFAKGQWYPRGQARLNQSLKDTGFDGDILLYSDESQVGAPPHQQCPYGFKPFALLKAFTSGYTQVLWCDASVWAIRNIQPMFDHIDQHSHMFFLNTCSGEWTSDACLDQFSLTRNEAMNIPMLMGICMGFNMAHPMCQEFFRRWLRAAQDGKSFPGSWTNESGQVSSDPRVKGHRHDQSAASLIAWKLGMGLIVPHETFFEYYRHPHGGLFDGNLSLVQPHTVMIAQGM